MLSRALVLNLLVASTLLQVGLGQTTIHSVTPQTVAPSGKTVLVLTGKELTSSLRVVSSCAFARVEVVTVEADQATIELSLDDRCPLGPIGILVATDQGPLQPFVLVVDDLPSVVDNGRNHDLASAQEITTQNAVAGICDGSLSDFYRFHVPQAGQRVAFEVLTQQLNSPMDPMLRLLDKDGQLLRFVDDAPLGPECRFSHVFSEAGHYTLEITDSRYTPQGRYHLRIGDFPIVYHSYPLALSAENRPLLGASGPDAAALTNNDFRFWEDKQLATGTIAARYPQGTSSIWLPVLLRDIQQFVEPSKNVRAVQPAPTLLDFPVGINGQLSEPGEQDEYLIRGIQDTTVRFGSHTRSLGCGTVLQMELWNTAGKRVAGTSVSDSDEWSFEYRFPDTGEYRLTLRDLLGRGGNNFGYYVELTPAGTFAVALKPDATAREEFAVEKQFGACVLEVQVTRFGYEGEIELSLSSNAAGLRLLNPRIAAKATEARVYVVADKNWNSDSLSRMRLWARAKDDPEAHVRLVGSVGLHRTKRPYVPFPAAWNDGLIFLSGHEPAEAYYALESPKAVKFARPVTKHTTSISLKRLQAAFKAPVTLLPDALPPDWSLTSKVDADNYTTTFIRPPQSSNEPARVQLQVLSEFNGRGRIEPLILPIEWIDPLKLSLKSVGKIVAGQAATLVAVLERAGDDRQPVTLYFKEYPAGITGPESITMEAEQEQLTVAIQVAPDAHRPVDKTIAYEAVSTYQANKFTIAGRTLPLEITPGPGQIDIYPQEITFVDSKQRQQLVVTELDLNDTSRDWTREALLTSSDSSVAVVRGSVVFPMGDGHAQIKVQVGCLQRTIPVHVSNMEVDSRIGFESEVLVALSKQGCNSGACHGSPSGKGMFRLSLRAFDRQLDEATLIREDYGRRINWLEPEKSLLLLKPLMRVPHGGGKQIHQDDVAYEILRDWVSQGAAADPPETPRCIQLKVVPNSKRVLSLSHGGQQLAAVAHFADGSNRDVTHLVAYESSNTTVAIVNEQGLVTPLSQGESVILVRYLEHIESVPLMFIEHSPDFQWQSLPRYNFVDELVDAKLKQLHYQPTDICSDSEFLRRVSLDVIGILPTVEETRDFLENHHVNKRSEWIDNLLQRDEYARFWALKWGDYLKMTKKAVGEDGVYKYHRWVEDSFRQNMPYDQFARHLLTTSGSTLSNPPANFFRTSADMEDCVETVSQVFLGARLQCAKCHNHPFERWTQDNYYGLGAFFNRIKRRNTQRPGEMFIYLASAGDVTQPRTGERMDPWLPQVGSLNLSDDIDRREAFADWLLDAGNPYFARIEANRIWSQLFARGIVDPIDDFRDSNPPTNEALLDALTRDFVSSGFDRKHLLRTILNSRTYQASYQTNASNQQDSYYFSHQQPRLLSAEQLLDAVNHTLGLCQSFGSLPKGTRATHIPAPDLVKVDFLRIFGQPERSTVCACERTDDSNLGMAIELFNGTTLHEKLRDPENRFRQAIANGEATVKVINELYLAAMCRLPAPEELKAALDHCETRPDITAGIEDVCWALINTDEFLFQH